MLAARPAPAIAAPTLGQTYEGTQITACEERARTQSSSASRRADRPVSQCSVCSLAKLGHAPDAAAPHSCSAVISISLPMRRSKIMEALGEGPGKHRSGQEVPDEHAGITLTVQGLCARQCVPELWREHSGDRSDRRLGGFGAVNYRARLEATALPRTNIDCGNFQQRRFDDAARSVADHRAGQLHDTEIMHLPQGTEAATPFAVLPRPALCEGAHLATACVRIRLGYDDPGIRKLLERGQHAA